MNAIDRRAANSVAAASSASSAATYEAKATRGRLHPHLASAPAGDDSGADEVT
jgi:hypothetical protein